MQPNQIQHISYKKPISNWAINISLNLFTDEESTQWTNFLFLETLNISTCNLNQINQQKQIRCQLSPKPEPKL